EMCGKRRNSSGGSSSGMVLIGYGGQVRAVPAGATAIAQRDAVMKAVYQSIWTDEADDAANLAWVRNLYRDVYVATGGVPVPGEGSDGSFINYPDTDLTDPAWYTSGVPWHTPYYNDNYPHPQQAQAHSQPPHAI